MKKHIKQVPVFLKSLHICINAMVKISLYKELRDISTLGNVLSQGGTGSF